MKMGKKKLMEKAMMKMKEMKEMKGKNNENPKMKIKKGY